MAKTCSGCGMRLSFLQRLDFDFCADCGRADSPSRRYALAAELFRSVPSTALTADAPATLRPTSRRWVWAVTTGILAFFASWAAGVAITILIVRAIPPEVPNPTEAYEGFGDAIMGVFRFYVGTLISFVVAVVTGLLVSNWIAYRQAVPARTSA